jgi:hypothetical protein
MAFSYMPKLFGELRVILFAGHFIMTPRTWQTAGMFLPWPALTPNHRVTPQVDPRFQSVYLVDDSYGSAYA